MVRLFPNFIEKCKTVSVIYQSGGSWLIMTFYLPNRFNVFIHRFAHKYIYSPLVLYFYFRDF